MGFDRSIMRSLFLCGVLGFAPVAGADTHYVNVNCATPSAPFLSWGNAARVIQEAVDVATNGDTVLVADGTYSNGGWVAYSSAPTNNLTNRVVILKPVTVQSVNGPTVTTIVGRGPIGPGAVRCAYVTNNAVLAGFTLKFGATLNGGDGLKERSGGGAWCEKSGVVSNCVIANCQANLFGGGAYQGVLQDCSLSINNSQNGGGCYQSKLFRCTVDSNTASVNGGGVNTCNLFACVVNQNVAFQSGGGAMGSTLTHCTVSGNSAATGGGVYLGYLTNSIVYFNAALSGSNYYNATFRFSCTTPAAPGTGNTNCEPVLVSASHVAADSPCVGRGFALATNVLGADIDGDVWGLPPCMGADEPVANSSTGALSVLISSPVSKVVVGVETPLVARILGRPNRSVWNFGDGTVVTNQPFTSHMWNTAGTKTVQLIAWNATSGSNGVVATRVFTVVTQSVYYVDISNRTPSSPYSTWQTAATNIQQAINASTTWGREIVVADGIYDAGGQLVFSVNMTNRIALNNAVVVRSLNGPSKTIIKGNGPPRAGAIRCAYVGKDCVLAGFTLTNGGTCVSGDVTKEMSGGGAWCDADGVVSNCWIFGNSAMNGGGAYGGKVIDCVISGNSAVTGGGAYNVALNNSLIVQNAASSGVGAAMFATLANCTVTKNGASNTCGGVASSSVFNSIVWDNKVRTAISNHVSSTFNYSCTWPLATGLGNITNAPLFIDATLGDYRLSAQSPCVNRGQNESWMGGANDLSGMPRIRIGRVDMGAYEFFYFAEIRCLLQGPYDPEQHSMFVPFAHTNNILCPLLSPYKDDIRRVASVPTNVIDWVLVELWESWSNRVSAQSCFLDSQGWVRGLDGGLGIPVDATNTYCYFVVKHRNHLAAMSSYGGEFSATESVLFYDFTVGPDWTGACVELEPGVWGLRAGDADGDGKITLVDREIVGRQTGKAGYLQGDLNLDGKVDGGDE